MNKENLYTMAKNKLFTKLPHGFSKELEEKYYTQLEQELNLVSYLGVEDCFLQVSKLVTNLKSKFDFKLTGAENGSLLAWILGITDVNPMKYDLLFGRFLNKNSKRITFCFSASLSIISEIEKFFSKDMIIKREDYSLHNAESATELLIKHVNHNLDFFIHIYCGKFEEIYTSLSFNDKVNNMALSRDGVPKEFIAEYRLLEKGITKPNYYHPLLEYILKDTMGMIFYQEQIMRIAQIVAKYSIEEADNLRKNLAMRKANISTKEEFIKRSLENNMDYQFSNLMYEILLKYSPISCLKANIISEII